MKRLSAAALTLLLGAALAACGSEPAAGPSPSAGSAASPSPTAAQSSAPAPSPTAAETAVPAPSAADGAPAAREPAKILYRMNKAYDIVPIDKTKASAQVVLLTFDDGPKDSKTLEPLLDALDKHKAKAIFFVNGYRVKAHPELLKQIRERGQTIGNHSWDHIMLGKEKADKIRKQIEDVQAIVKDVAGVTPVFFRPPYASGNADVHRIAEENGLLYMTWSNGSLDWTLGAKDADKPQKVIDNVLKQLRPGSNILMHELPWTGEALDRLLTVLEQKGYGFVDPATIETKTAGS
jgi:peptidoglycan/xylan/chitin deacetylase (PgdA/CDA1 family)